MKIIFDEKAMYKEPFNEGRLNLIFTRADDDILTFEFIILQ